MDPLLGAGLLTAVVLALSPTLAVRPVDRRPCKGPCPPGEKYWYGETRDKNHDLSIGCARTKSGAMLLAKQRGWDIPNPYTID